MKTRWIFLVLVAFALEASAHSVVEFDLDVSDAALRAKTPVVIYIGNDFIAPLNSMTITRNTSFIRAVTHGQQLFTRDDIGAGAKPIFSEAELQSYKKLSAADQAYLVELGKWSSSDISQPEVSIDTENFESGICKENQKYPSALVILRNFPQPGPLSETKKAFRWMHCGPNPKRDRVMTLKETDISSVLPDLAAFTAAEQPVTHEGLLRLLFKEIGETYPPATHRYLVVVHSVGRSNEVLSPRHTFSYEKLPVEEVRKVLLDRKTEFTDANGALKKDRGFAERLEIALRSIDKSPMPEVGLSLDAFMGILKDAVADAQYPLVILDGSGLDLKAIEKDRHTNVGSVFYTSDAAPPYRVFKWETLFRYVGVKATDLEDRMRELLKSK